MTFQDAFDSSEYIKKLTKADEAYAWFKKD